MRKNIHQNYQRFQNAQRADVKLMIALEEYLYLQNIEEQSVEKTEYRKYLYQRRRAAWEVLIREENLDGLQLFVTEQWLGLENINHCVDLASKMKKKESLLWLLNYQWRLQNTEEQTEKDFKRIKNTKDTQTLSLHSICEDIKNFLKEKLQKEIPALGSAFPHLEWKEDNREEWGIGTDGVFLYYNERQLLLLADQGMEHLARTYLHTLFHCLYLHMLFPEELKEKDQKNWNLACDLAVEWALDKSGWFPLERKQQKARNDIYIEMRNYGCQQDTKTCWEWVRHIDEPKKENVKKLFCTDAHDYWYAKRTISRKKKLEEGEKLTNIWGKVRKTVSMQSGGEQFQKGQRSGSGKDFYQIKKTKVYDYRKFLRQFAVTREEIILDMESIDYIPYYYGLERYGNILLIEPLETTEVNRLEEFVIAIDTSGSCSGAVVKRFLEETYGILSARENFFQKMKVHIIQCDSMIQDHKIITCEDDWKKYQENVQIQGLGGTDFTPVFRLVDQMLERKEIRKLKGLMYFTDGDGIFPRQKPSYETAFVFLNQALEKQKIPDWAIRLNLDVKIE